MPLLIDGEPPGSWRDCAVSEGDYGFRSFVRACTGQPVDGCRMFMVRSREWKYVHYENLPPQLYDLHEDPRELHDRGRDPGLARIREEHGQLLFDWLRRRRIHPTIADRDIDAWTAREAAVGTHIGVW